MYNYRDNSTSSANGGYPQLAVSHQQLQLQLQQVQQLQLQQQQLALLHPDSLAQNIGQINNNVRNLSNFAQYTAQQYENGLEVIAASLNDGFHNVVESINLLSKQIEKNNLITLFTLRNFYNNNGNETQEQQNRRNEDFTKLVNQVGNIDNTLFKDNSNVLGVNQPGNHHQQQHRNSSNSRLYLTQSVNPQLQQQKQLLHRRDLTSHHGSSTSLSASLKSNITPPNSVLAQQRLIPDKRQFANTQQGNPIISPLVPQLPQPSQLQQQKPLRARTSSQLASLDSSSPENNSKKQKKSYKDHEPIYILTQPSKVSIRDAWLEYTVGLNGNPLVRDLENQYKTRWRGGSNHTISKQYTNRIAFYRFLEDLESQNSLEFGIKFLEDYCEKNGGKNLRWLQFNMPTELDFRRYSFENRGPSL